ncbi:hypothetical protein ACHHYP_10237 [Achlya hypogyna]|uniref:Helicase-associated domain-containing protein n=1 Tax=Achlya hypogyna TaxID=1202772 RepID=A0A1V9YLV7_ACHHY|nr:hypothetical protein ACHHYP_10237 [Achlya hypogyna]
MLATLLRRSAGVRLQTMAGARRSAASLSMSLEQQHRFAAVAQVIHETTRDESDYTQPPSGPFSVPAEEPWPAAIRGREINFSFFRMAHRRGLLAPQVVAEMNAIKFVWEPYVHKWTLTLDALKTYGALHRDLLVPAKYIVPSSAPFARDVWGLKLGFVVDNLRRKPVLRDGLREQLDAIGFVWDHHDLRQQLKISAIQHFYALHGHTTIHQSFVVPADESWPSQFHGLHLGQYIDYLRRCRNSVSPQVRQMLAPTSFEWDPRAAAWQAKLQAVDVYRALHGHANIPFSFVVPEDDTAWPTATWGQQLGKAVRMQTRPDRVAALEARGVPLGGRGRKSN